MATHALVRTVSRALAACELEHLPRPTFDLDRARAQHANYVRALEAAGLTVTVLPEEPALADSCFVEDPLIVLDEVAIVGRLARPSREPEAARIAPAIERFRRVVAIKPPGTLEGGDVLRLGRTLWVGLSGRTNASGAEQLRRLAEPLGYEVRFVPVRDCLHLKTGATSPGPGLVLVNPAWIDPAHFQPQEIMEVSAREPWAANVLPVNGRVLAAASAPETAERLRTRGWRIVPAEIAELQKAEAGLTCLSVVF